MCHLYSKQQLRLQNLISRDRNSNKTDIIRALNLSNKFLELKNFQISKKFRKTSKTFQSTIKYSIVIIDCHYIILISGHPKI